MNIVYSNGDLKYFQAQNNLIKIYKGFNNTVFFVRFTYYNTDTLMIIITMITTITMITKMITLKFLYVIRSEVK